MLLSKLYHWRCCSNNLDWLSFWRACALAFEPPLFGLMASAGEAGLHGNHHFDLLASVMLRRFSLQASALTWLQSCWGAFLGWLLRIWCANTRSTCGVAACKNAVAPSCWAVHKLHLCNPSCAYR